MSTNAAKPVKHLGYIDALRGVAVAGVIGIHTTTVAHIEGFLKSMVGFGQRGVQLFYVISAFTLMMSMMKRNRTELYPHVNFFIRRFFRIAPAFYLTILAYSLLGHRTWSGPVSARQVLFVMTFFNGWRPDLINWPVMGQWSIAVEMMFYLLLPFVFPLLTNFRRAVMGWWLAIALSIFSRYLAMHLSVAEGFTGPPLLIEDFGSRWFLSQLPIFFSGIGLYFFVQERISWKRVAVAYLPGLLFLGILRHINHEVGLFPAYGVIIMAGVALLSRHPTAIVTNKTTLLLGKVSFSAYLCHPLILMALQAPLVRISGLGFNHPYIWFLLVYCLVISLTTFSSLLIWHLIESPGQQLGRKLIDVVNKRHKPQRVTELI